MKKLLLILLLPMIGFGQGWERFYGGFGNCGRYSVDVVENHNSEYVFIARDLITNHFPLGDAQPVIKVSSIGDSIWFNDTINIPEWTGIIDTTLDGGYIFSSGNEYTKTDSNLNIEWTTSVITPGGVADMISTKDNGFLIIGAGQHPDSVGWTSATYRLFLTKINNQGDSLWTKRYLSATTSRNCVYQTTDSGYIVLATAGDKVYLIKLDINGDVQWQRDYSTSQFHSQTGSSVQQTLDGGYVLCILRKPQDSLIPHRIRLIKTDDIGNIEWEELYGWSNIDNFNFAPFVAVLVAQQTLDGGYIIFHNSGLIKTNSFGDTSWTREYAYTEIPNKSYTFNSGQQSSDGGFVVVGKVRDQNLGTGNSPNCSPFIMKTNGNGKITSTFNIPIPNANRKLKKVVDILGRETKGKTNEPLFYIYDDGTVEKRITID